MSFVHVMFSVYYFFFVPKCLEEGAKQLISEIIEIPFVSLTFQNKKTLTVKAIKNGLPIPHHFLFWQIWP